MFARENRFSFKNKLPKNTFNSPSFNIRYDKNEGGLQVAVVVSKKVDKRAVVRNKVKRTIIEALKKNIDKNQSLTLVFYAKQGAASSESLEKEVKEAIGKVADSSLRSE